MIIEAMDILFTKDIDCFCIATSDSDFIRLTQRIREEGKIVIGMGRQHTIPAFVNACNEFKFLDVLSSEDDSNHIDDSTSITPIDDIKNYISQYIAAKDGKSLLATLKPSLISKFSDFDERNYGFFKFSTFLKSLGDYDVDSLNVYTNDNNYSVICSFLQSYLKDNSPNRFTSVQLQNQIVKKFGNVKLINFGYNNMKSFLTSISNIEKSKNKYYYKEN